MTETRRPGRAPASRPGGAGGTSRIPRWAPYVVVVLGWLAALPFTRHYVNPDGTAYVQVSRLLLDGEWAAAVNGYWGPLISWLMTPLLAVGIPEILSLRLVLLGAALLTLGPLRSLARRAGASDTATGVVLLGVAPFLVYTVLFGAYPDVLMGAALVRCCDLLFRPSYETSVRTALAAGVWAAVACLAKSYAVPVVLVLLPLAALVHLVSTRGLRPAPLVRQGVLSLVAVTVLFGAWAGVLSVSYGEPTYSTSADFNARLVAPGSAGNPFNYPGLYPPARADALSAWDEPSELPIPARTDSGDDPDGGEAAEQEAGALAERAESIYGNARIVVGSVLRRGLPLVLLAGVALVWHARHRRLPSTALTGPLLAGAVAAGGLLLIIAIERYLWFPILALVPAAAVGFDVVVGFVADRRRRLVVPGLAVAVVGVLGLTSLQGLVPRWDLDADVTVAADALEEQGGLDGDVASTDNDWNRTLLLCLEVGCQYFGRPVAQDADAAAAELFAAGIEHLLVWDADPGELTGLPPVEGPGVLTVYTVTPQGLVPDRRVGGGSGD